MKRNFILWLLVASCSFVISCSGNDVVNGDDASSKAIVFNEINSQIDILNDKYLSVDLLTRTDGDTKIKWWQIAKADLAGAAVGAGAGSVFGGVVGASVGSVVFGTVYSFEEYWTQAKKPNGDTGGEGDSGGGNEGNGEMGDGGEVAEVSIFDVNKYYPIRDTPKLDELEDFEFTDAGYFHNEIIKILVTNKIFDSSEISYDALFYEVIDAASYGFFEVDNYIQPSLFDSFIGSLDANILYSDECALLYDMLEEIIIIRKYFDTVVQLSDFNEAYEYTIYFLYEVNNLLLGESEYESSLEIINSSISVAIYSRMLWNLYEYDPVLSDNYSVFNVETGEWE